LWSWSFFHPSVSSLIHGWHPVTRPSVPSSIHGWHHTGKKTLAEINNPPSAHVSLSRRGMPGPGLLSWSAVRCYLMGHKQCKHQDFQWPGSRWIHAECGIYRGFGNVVCSCNFVICTVKYTHMCIRHRVQTSLYISKQWVCGWVRERVGSFLCIGR
jgi:hypothetical protein